MTTAISHLSWPEPTGYFNKYAGLSKLLQKGVRCDLRPCFCGLGGMQNFALYCHMHLPGHRTQFASPLQSHKLLIVRIRGTKSADMVHGVHDGRFGGAASILDILHC